MSDFKLAKKVKIVRMSNESSIGMEFHEGLNKNESRLFLYLGTVNNMDMYSKEVKFMVDLLILGIMVP